MLPLKDSLELIQNYTKNFEDRKKNALKNTNPIIVEAAAMVYNTINNMNNFGEIIKDPNKRKYTDTFNEMFQKNEEPMDISIKDSGILNPSTGTVDRKVETSMVYWFYTTRELMNEGLKDMAFIPTLYIGNSETDIDTDSLTYSSQYFNKDKATIMIKLDNKFTMNQDKTPSSIIMADCIDCLNKDEFMDTILTICNEFKKLIISLRNLTPIESIQIHETMKENVMNIFKELQKRSSIQNEIMK